MTCKMNMLPSIQEALAKMPYPTRPEGLYEPIRYVLDM